MKSSSAVPGTGAVVLCTYCGSFSTSTQRCTACGGYFDLLSRQRTQNAMGPWYIRDEDNPFHPGCSYDTLRRLVARGRIQPDTVMRGPTTRQFWSFAKNTPGVAHLLGTCHACHAKVETNAVACSNCNASFVVANDRQALGLAPVQMLPGDVDPSAIADAAFGPATPAAPPSQAHRPAVPTPMPSNAGPETSQTRAQPGRVVASPSRKRSAGPMIAVTASVGCAAVALVAIVLMNRVADDSNTAAAMPPASTSDVIDARADFDIAPVPAPAPEPAIGLGDNDVVAVNGASAVESVPISNETSASAAEPEETTPAALVPDPEPVEADDSRAASIGSMSVSELEDIRAAWLADGELTLVEAVDRRLEQLRLRSMFGSAEESGQD